jgi:hypothetical protein
VTEILFSHWNSGYLVSNGNEVRNNECNRLHDEGWDKVEHLDTSLVAFVLSGFGLLLLAIKLLSKPFKIVLVCILKSNWDKCLASVSVHKTGQV